VRLQQGVRQNVHTQYAMLDIHSSSEDSPMGACLAKPL
jgi:hypothetical protein